MYISLFYLTIYSFITPIINNNNNIVNFIKNKNININSLTMNFEEIDGDYDSNGNLINKTLQNEALKNIKNITYDCDERMWIIDLNTGNAKEINHENINFNMEKEINIENDNINNDNFPSFYKFLREREIKEIKEKDEYLKKSKNNQNFLQQSKEKYKDFEPTSKDLKLLSSFSTTEWMKTWLYEMIHVPDYFPTFMYQDMFRMREFGQKNTTKNYFYIGYYPIDANNKQGPYYIGAFELIPSLREFRTHVIIQNPYYCVEKIYDNKKIMNFKKELMALCNDSNIFFNFANLKHSNDQRYFYSWLYEE